MRSRFMRPSCLYITIRSEGINAKGSSSCSKFSNATRPSRKETMTSSSWE